MPSTAQIAAAPAVDVGRPGVVGGKRGDHVAVVAIEQFAQQEGAVADVDFGIGEVVQLEGGAAAVALDFVRRFRRDLHQPARAGARGAVAELRLRVDHRGDQRRVDVLFARLLADHVLVAQGQGELLDRPVDRPPCQQHAGDDTGGQRRAANREAPPSPFPNRRFAPRSSAPASRQERTGAARDPRACRRSRSRARRGPPSPPGTSWRASRSPTRACPRASARARRTSSAVTTATVVSKTGAISPSKSSGTSTTATSASLGQASRARRRSARRPADGSAPPATSAHLDRQRRSRRSCARSTRPSGATSSPQRSVSLPSSGSESSSSCTTASLEIVAAPSRSNAARAVDFPAAIPPVNPIVSGTTS